MAVKRVSLREQREQRRREQATQAAAVAEQIGRRKPEPAPQEEEALLETVSYNLPADLVDLLRSLAAYRAQEFRERRKAARRAGKPEPEGEARVSASKIVLAALEPHREEWEAELAEIKARLG